MSRVIKFKKWHKELQDMTFWDGTKGSNNLFWHTLTEYPDMYNLMQFTGLKDKNGIEIYEGDVLDGHSDGYTVVEYTEANGGYDCVFSDDNSVCIAELTSWFGNQAIVIGNIYENPELL